MVVIDLDEFPDRTEEILMALWRYEEASKKEELHNKWMKRRMLADETSLNKQKVRYRLQQLVKENFVHAKTVIEHNQEVTYYSLQPDGLESARGIGEAEKVLGEIPKKVSQQDILKLASEMAALRAEIEAAGFDLDRVKSSKFKEEIDRSVNDSYEQWKFIKCNEDDIEDLWKAVLDIQHKLGINVLSADKHYDHIDKSPDVW